MGRRYADLNLEPSGTENAEPLFKMAVELGYRIVSTANFNPSYNIKDYERIARKFGLDYVSRLDIVITTPSKAKRVLGKYRRKFELMVARPRTLEGARFAARDSRIDLVLFDSVDLRFDNIQARMMASNGKALEIVLSKIIFSKDIDKEFLKIINILSLCKKYDVKIVATSGAKTPLEMRAPLDIAALLTVMGLPSEKARDTVSRIPINILNVNRNKLSNKYISPGIWVVDDA